MHPTRIAELLQPFLSPTRLKTCHSERRQESAALSSSQLQAISTYLDLLLRWNARINLTAVRQPEEIVTRHFGESLFTARCLFPEVHSDDRVLDLGSGAGFPGLPIKLWAPHIHLTLIESNHKKATFLREVVRALALTNVNVFAARAEEFTAAPAAIVTLRAVERFDSTLPVAARLVAPGGRLALLIGEPQFRRARDLASTFAWDDPIPLPLSQSRLLLLGSAPC